MADIRQLEKQLAELKKKVADLETKKQENFDLESDLLVDKLEQLEQQARAEREIAELRGDQLELEKEAIKLSERQAAAATEQFKAAQKIIEARAAGEDIADEAFELAKEELEVSKETLKVATAKTKELQAQATLTEKQKEADKQIAEERKKASKQAAIDFGAAIGLASSYQESTLGSISGTFETIAGNAGAFAGQLAETFAPMNLLSNVFEKVLEATVVAMKAYDSATASFNQATGAADEYNSVIAEVGENNRNLGIGFEEAAGSAQALFQNMSSFTNLQKDTQAQLTKTVATLEKVGVSGATTAKNLDTMQAVMGLTASQANELVISLGELDIGIDPAKIAEDFAAATPIMAKFGKDGVQVFKDLEKQSKATGIEFSSLLSITEQFDTFESAAQAAGKLNAILGGNLLNSVELLNASESERIAMLRESVIASGKSWESMSRFERQSLAAAAGISDLSQAARLFSASTDFDSVTEQQKELEERAKAAATTQEKLANLMQAFAAGLLPLVDVLSSVVDKISTFLSENKTLTKVLGVIVLLLGVFATAVSVATAAVAAFGTAAFTAVIPFLPLIAAITLIIGLIAALVIYWDDLTAGVKDLTGGFLDMWDVLLVGVGVIMGPIGWFILAAKKIYDNWDFLVTGLTEMWTGFAEFFAVLWDGLVGVAVGPLNAIVKMFNETLGGLSLTFPDWMPVIGGQTFGIPKIPMLADGGTIEQAGLAIVGEEGPEMLKLPEGAKVSPLDNEVSTVSMDGLSDMLMGPLQALFDPFGVARGAAEVITRVAEKGPSDSGSKEPTTVVLQLNDREFARAVIKVLDKKMDLRTA